MKNFFQLSLTFIVIFCLSASCKKKDGSTVGGSEKKEVKQSKFAKNYPEFNSQVFKDVLLAQSDSALSPLYRSTEYTPIWIHDTLDTKKLYEFIEILKIADEHGLSPELFSYSKIKLYTDSIDSGLYANNMDTLYKKMLLLEQEATKAAIIYISGMSFGFLNPKNLYAGDYNITILQPDSAFWADTYSKIANDPINTILASHPNDNVYLKLQTEYRNLKNRDKSEQKKIPVKDVTYKLGAQNKHIAEIAERLMLTGEYVPDSIPTDSLHQKLDEKLLAAINTFRKKISYLEDSEVGKLTIEALNRPFEYYQKKISANMERYRWKRTKQTHKKHIEVNVAAAMLTATDADNSPLIMRVCVGSVKNKTPLLQSDINYLNLNPYWNVPRSIAQKEIAVLQKKDSTYIRRHNMKLFKGGKEVETSSIDWKNINPSTFSYIIRQEPGGGNSLGLVKFMFNNDFSVYLHDTPSKSAFNRKNRAVSHGCVRVQRPFDLAYFCLSPVTEVYKDRLLYTVKKEPVSKEGKQLLKANNLKKLPDVINIDPENKISLFIDYYTAFLYPSDDTLYYADDMYEYDNIILDKLNSL